MKPKSETILENALEKLVGCPINTLTSLWPKPSLNFVCSASRVPNIVNSYDCRITRLTDICCHFSVLQLEDCEEIDLTSPRNGLPVKKHDASSNNNANNATTTNNINANRDNQVAFTGGQRRSLLEGFLGCLRPVWTIIGKATAAEKQITGRSQVHISHKVIFAQV